MKQKDFAFIGHNLTKYHGLRLTNDSAPLLANISFKIKNNETMAFIFETNALEKQALARILQGKDRHHSGFLEFNSQIYFAKSKQNPRQIISFNDLEEFYQKGLGLETFGFLKEIHFFRNQIDKMEQLLKRTTITNHMKKNLFLFEAKKIDLETNKKINQEMILITGVIDGYLKKLKPRVKELMEPDEIQEALKIIGDFYQEYQEYLAKRLNLIYNKNEKLLLYWVNELKNGDVVPNVTLETKIKNLHEEISQASGANTKRKNNFNLQKIKLELDQIRHKNLMLLRIKQNEFKFFYKRYKAYKNNYQNDPHEQINKTKSLYKAKTNLFFIDFLNKNAKKIFYLNHEQMNNFINEINAQHALLLFESNVFVKNSRNLNNKKAINQWLINIFKLDLDHFAALSTTNYNEIKQQYQDDEQDTGEKNHFDWNNNLEWKKVQFQNLKDEFNWLKKHNVIAMNKRIVHLNFEAKKIIEQYQELKKTIERRLTLLMKIRNHLLALANETKTDYSQWEKQNTFFKAVNEECLQIACLLQTNTARIEFFFKNKINENKTAIFKKILRKYQIYNLIALAGIDLVQIKNRQQALSNLEVAKLFLVQALLSKKPVLIFNNLLQYLKPEEHQLFISLYKNIAKNFVKIWIHFCNSYKEIAGLTNSINIIKDAVNLEFGKVQQINKNPFYRFSATLLNQENQQNFLFEPIAFDHDKKKYLYDYYRLNDHHYVYAAAEEIYQQIKQLPTVCEWTLNPLKIDELKNKLMQEIEQQQNQEIEISQENDFEETELEGIIIDVKPGF